MLARSARNVGAAEIVELGRQVRVARSRRWPVRALATDAGCRCGRAESAGRPRISNWRPPPSEKRAVPAPAGWRDRRKRRRRRPDKRSDRAKSLAAWRARDMAKPLASLPRKRGRALSFPHSARATARKPPQARRFRQDRHRRHASRRDAFARRKCRRSFPRPRVSMASSHLAQRRGTRDIAGLDRPFDAARIGKSADRIGRRKPDHQPVERGFR